MTSTKRVGAKVPGPWTLFALLVTVAWALALLTFNGCAAVQVKAKKYARCDIRVPAPHRVLCFVDGRMVFEQTGPMALTVEGVAKPEPSR